MHGMRVSPDVGDNKAALASLMVKHSSARYGSLKEACTCVLLQIVTNVLLYQIFIFNDKAQHGF